MRSFTEGQRTMESVAMEHGFHKGCYIMRKSDKLVACIEAFQGDKVLTTIEDGPLTGKATFLVEVMLGGKWKVVQKKKDPEIIDFQQIVPLRSKEFQLHVAKGQIMQALWNLERDNQHVHANLKVQLKPRSVFTLAPFPRHQLKLVPVSWRIDGHEVGSSSSKDRILGLCLGQWAISPGATPKHVFFVNGMFQPVDKDGSTERAFLAPYWFVKSTDKRDEANMEFHPNVFEPDAVNQHGQVPILRNSKAIGRDQELMCYIKPKAPEQEYLEPVQGPSKRLRSKKQASA